MKRTLVAALAALTLTSGGAVAQGLQPSGTRAGGTGQFGGPGEIGPEQRVYLRSYMSRYAAPPVTLTERVGRGYVVPGAVELRAFPDEVYGTVPSMRSYRYFSSGGSVVVVDPGSRAVIDVIE